MIMITDNNDDSIKENPNQICCGVDIAILLVWKGNKFVQKKTLGLCVWFFFSLYLDSRVLVNFIKETKS